IATPVAGTWNTVALPSASVTAGAKYWIAVLAPSGAGTVQFRDVATGGRSQTSAQSGLTGLPATRSPGANFGNAPMSAHLAAPPPPTPPSPPGTPPPRPSPTTTRTPPSPASAPAAATPTASLTASTTPTSTASATAAVTPTASPTASTTPTRTVTPTRTTTPT